MRIAGARRNSGGGTFAGHRQSQAQMHEFANLTAELLVGQRGPEVQLEGMRIGVKVEKLETYSGEKGCDLDT